MTSAQPQPPLPAGQRDAPPSAAEPPPDHALDTALDAERDALRELFPLPPARTPRRPRAAGLRNGGVAVLVAAIAAAALWGLDPAWRTEHHATAVGERRDVPLADGSTLTLDTATALDVAWHLRSRRVALHQGQARFAVAHSGWRPFEVAAADTRIRVVGTVFDVRRDQGRVQVTVLQGRVEVSRRGGPAAPWLLAPGQRLRLDTGAAPAAGAAPRPEAVDSAQAGAWQQGRLVFDRTPLRDALVEVQRYRRAPIRLRDDGALGRHAVTGVFEAGRTDQLLDLLPRIAPAQVRRHADGSVDVAPAGR